MLNLGYACINVQLAEEGITTNRGMIRRTFQQKGVAYASQLALQNVQALYRILQWNVEQGIRVFRITSELFPWASEYPLEEMPDFGAIRDVLQACGRLPIRMSTHPGPFNKMAGSGPTLENTIRDLEIHARLFDLMGLPPTHWNKINIHVGGAYGDKADTLKRFADNFGRLSLPLRQRLTVENDDKPGLYTVADLLGLHESTGIPIVFDYFHHRLHNGGMSEAEAFSLAYDTWDLRPVFHYSSSRRDHEEPTAKAEAHADYVYEPINTYGKDVDIVLEAKMKEKALERYLTQFGPAHPLTPSRGEGE
ncbi:UV DNA damage repair endonuclease UvsE [Flaviaesturariibacter aridisoli]|uniref:UV DNA damage repair endonuclease UvsE n=1 Tax=Flaviaesturariibacter aridisoli TaxID=2545761 RepID=A0A4R4DZQ1_9BACT|nr:UV DNA damage repair endonuclease UvsE [Flaviaesturariibacter aridisoli]TCZ69930.1 UV DNA damage repair endonuclease UvsE [Flaviaesturariibacter aridisoli]